jgi:hypothetical protein
MANRRKRLPEREAVFLARNVLLAVCAGGSGAQEERFLLTRSSRSVGRPFRHTPGG